MDSFSSLADDISAHGGEPVMTPCGYAFVHQALRDTGAALGGEFSGHFFFSDPDFRFDDAILATVKLLTIVARSQRPLSALVAELPAYYSSPAIRLACPDEIKSQVVEQVRVHFRAAYPVDETDGARIDFGDGWALVRASNTQPALSLRFEARSEERLEQLKTQVLDQVNYWMTNYGVARRLAVVILAAGQGKRTDGGAGRQFDVRVRPFPADSAEGRQGQDEVADGTTAQDQEFLIRSGCATLVSFVHACFLFLIRENSTGSILFMGRVMDPTK
jgi:hypothetical protein